MAVIWIPALLRDLTAGKDRVTVSGRTLRQAIDELEATYPGIKERLLDGDQLRPEISVFVDGIVSHLRLRQQLTESIEVHLLSAISGG